jgi:hypothetical protein
LFKRGWETGEVEHLTSELTENGGEVWMLRGGAYPDGIEVRVALQLNMAKDVAGADEVANINKLLNFPVHGGGNGVIEVSEGEDEGVEVTKEHTDEATEEA